MSEIILDNVNLYYSSAAYKEQSIKALLTQCLMFSKYNKNIKNIQALKDISFSIGPGERVGLLGCNGAGKSTLLKTIAGLYPLSTGKLITIGKIRALFDLSLGFEPEATGRENILYRGLLLGLSKSFIHSKKDEIIEFASLGKFIDYPIKTYSSGMQVRLAFAISTLVGADILLLDEVIHVGDAAFIQKAKKRLMQLIEKSEILILASHDLYSLKSLCQRGLVLHEGQLVFDGIIESAISNYQSLNGIIDNESF